RAQRLTGVLHLAERLAATTAPASTEDAGAVTDEILMQRYARGDTAAFDTLYARHRGPLYRYLLRGCGNRDAAGELFQDVWARLIRARHRYRPRARFTTWLFRMAQNRLIDHSRRQRPRGDMPADLAAPDHDNPEQRTDRRQAADRLLIAIAALPFEQREAILLKEERDLSLAAIAEVTGVGRETVKSRLRYALAKLREVLPDD